MELLLSLGEVYKKSVYKCIIKVDGKDWFVEYSFEKEVIIDFKKDNRDFLKTDIKNNYRIWDVTNLNPKELNNVEEYCEEVKFKDYEKYLNTLQNMIGMWSNDIYI